MQIPYCDERDFAQSQRNAMSHAQGCPINAQAFTLLFALTIAMQQRMQSQVDTLLALSAAGADARAGAAGAEPMDAQDDDGHTLPSDRSDGERPAAAAAHPVQARPQRAQSQLKRPRAAPVVAPVLQRASTAPGPGLGDSAVGEKKAKKEALVPIPPGMSKPARASSRLWNHFRMYPKNAIIPQGVAPDALWCVPCGAFAGKHTGGTSALSSHLRVKHADIWKVEQERGGSQQTLSLPMTKPQQEMVEQKLIEWVVGSALPFSTTEGWGFKEFCAALNVNFKVPGRKKVRELSQTMYKTRILPRVKDLVHSADFGVIAIDGWSKFARKFLGVAIHWIDKDWAVNMRYIGLRFHNG